MSINGSSHFVRPVVLNKVRRVAVFLSLSAMIGVGAAVAQTADAASQPAPKLTFFSADPAMQALSSSTSSSSSSVEAPELAINTMPTLGLNAMQYGGGRRYGRPRYRGGNTNPDGSSKWMGYGGAGFVQPVGNTWHYFTPSYGIQVGFGRQYSNHFAVPIEFDYDYFGMTKQTLDNQLVVYTDLTNQCNANAACLAANGNVPVAPPTQLDGNMHDWSFSIDPRYSFYQGDGLGAYGLVGVGFYHKVSNFLSPEQEEYCDPYYGCEVIEANAIVDHYSSNAPGFAAGFGLTYKFSHFSNEKFYAEARYVFTDNSYRAGITVNNVNSNPSNYLQANDFPANSNRTTYIPIKFGIEF